jgi:hypothetical protein
LRRFATGSDRGDRSNLQRAAAVLVGLLGLIASTAAMVLAALLLVAP